jgi:hypothetical protein
LRIVARRNIARSHYPQIAAPDHKQGLHYNDFRGKVTPGRALNQSATTITPPKFARSRSESAKFGYLATHTVRIDVARFGG